MAAQYIPAAYSLAAVGVWGTSDFLGGVGTKRTNAFLFTTIVHVSGMLVVGAIAWMIHAPFPSAASVAWSMLAGGLGGLALVFFYRALSQGNMGLIAPVAAVLSASIPTVFTAFHEGFPGKLKILGFIFAGVGVWLISRTEGGSGRPEGIGVAILCGIGFAGFYMCVSRAGNANVLWVSSCSRLASFAITGTIVLFGKYIAPVRRSVLGIAIIAGLLDISGTIAFVLASRTGRLDAAVVLSSLYPAITVLLARLFLNEHFSRARTLGMVAALAAVPMIAG